MKKWFYFIVPAALLVVFSFFYLAHAKEAKIKEQKREVKIALEIQQEKERKAAIEEQARLDAAKHAAERLAKKEAKEAERLAQWEADGKKIADTTNKYNSEANRFAQQASELEVELDTLQKLKDQTNSDVLNLAKEVELGRIAKRNAEMEIQRKTENIIIRAEKSAMATMPVHPPPSGRRR